MPLGLNPQPADLVAILEHHRNAQALTIGLHEIVRCHQLDPSPDLALDQLIAPLNTALRFHGHPAQQLRQLQEALDTGSTPENILHHLKHCPARKPDLEQALLKYETLLTQAGDLHALAHTHQLALDLATAPQYKLVADPQVRFGKPCLKNLRISVYDVIEYLASGMSAAELIHDFPDLTYENINTCMAFAKDLETRMKQKAPG